MKIPAMKFIYVPIAVSLLLVFGCVSQNEMSSIDNRLSEIEMRNAETQKKSEALKSDLQNREEDGQANDLDIGSTWQHDG